MWVWVFRAVVAGGLLLYYGYYYDSAIGPYPTDTQQVICDPEGSEGTCP